MKETLVNQEFLIILIEHNILIQHNHYNHRLSIHNILEDKVHKEVHNLANLL